MSYHNKCVHAEKANYKNISFKLYKLKYMMFLANLILFLILHYYYFEDITA